MTASYLFLLAVLFYFITWFLVVRDVRASIANPNTKSKPKKYYFYAWFLALVLHIFGLHYPLLTGEAMTLSFIALGSYVMWFLSLILFITTIRRKVESLAIFILPFTMLSIVATLVIGSDTHTVINMRSGLGVHILFSLLAYSVLMLASFQALLLATQNKQLHTHQNSGFIRTLPSLEDMEHLLFRFIAVGLALLSIALITGFYYLDNLFGSGIAHKTILSIVAWVVFSVLLFGRWKYGWRGKTAVRWTLGGFIVLMLAFFGTKFVQEFLLDTPKHSTAQSTLFIHNLG